ncbi:DUF4129 domain-containing protein [Streptomyces alkaliterrae]|uniref:DUF4129 domain-containing protein n=1 Tax=Streptomyces alkaliterrae TaxID=2213162 RepID=UPI002B209DD6|nr:DUF4129 domain-containing protein [Streptomyces alkaliterrae]
MTYRAALFRHNATPALPGPQDDEVPVELGRRAAREAAERELSGPEYREHEPGLLRRALGWLVDQLERLLSAGADVTPAGWVGVAAVLLLAVALIIAVRLRLGRLRHPTGDRSASLFADSVTTAAQHRAAAERLAAEHRWSEAVQERTRALVRSLEERTLLTHRPGRTADEAAAEAGDALPAYRDELRLTARSFDEVTYAHRAADVAAYRRIRDLDEAVARTSLRPTPTGRPGAEP